ncbi:deoxyribodipyrimidine photo-lyase [Mariniblastus sp.]|nr:deoxyribodipyrimidine photo-lyase [Mariniblastus sp.]
MIWFRRDLRISDNTALFEATQHADDGVVGVFLITPKQWQEHRDANCKVKFLIENVRNLSNRLAELNIPLLIRTCDDFQGAPSCISNLANETGCDTVFINREYEVNESRRDDRVSLACEQAGVALRRFHDRIIVPPKAISTKEGKFYSVFTPYRRVWDSTARETITTSPQPSLQPEIPIKCDPVPETVAGFDFSNTRSDLWPAGEDEAQQRLERFSQNISAYNIQRDIPSVRGTSLLSPYLNIGAISPRQCFVEADRILESSAGENEGAKTWVSELTWRDFYNHVMVACPRVSMNQPFKPKTNGIPWRTDESDFAAWKSGTTGYPIVDAGMRQLNQTGWMHNRLRMVTAMFLTKNLLIDWRWGESYFMSQLIDGDLSANNGGWQWSASTGTDSVPYFRIFNPFSQSKRFDPDGLFIRKMCPELRPVPAKALHDPAKLTAAISNSGIDYPTFVVDYKAGRERALHAFKSLK